MNEFLKKTCLIFFLYVDYFRVSCGETIHYTNSPRHLGISENYTSYKLEVPGSAPITVIEANRGPVGANQGIRGVQQRDWIEKAEILHRRKNSKAGMLDRKDSAEVHQFTEELDQDYAERIRNAQNGGSGGENRPLHDTTISHERLNDYVTVNEMDENEDEERKEKYSNFDANWAVDHNKYHDRDRNTGWVPATVAMLAPMVLG
uniref:Secreted protein n=1 Tax=Lutzomyia longipalpis TaxID=7200 RepID=A0A1B0GL03_LUTLO